jgi:uncharacterized DUF497 family protein
VYTLRIYSPKAFEWDPAKREANLRKHGIDFARAVRIFEAPVLERQDQRRDYGEPQDRKAHRHEKAAYRQIQSPEA